MTEAVSQEGIKMQPLSFKKKFKIWSIRWLAYLIIRLLHGTLRYEVVGADNRSKAEKVHPNGSFVIASWHQNGLLGITGHKNQGVYTLISPSFDGEIIAHVSSRFGSPSVRGSSSRHGREALKSLVQLVNHGKCAAFTVDGPRGPKHVVKPGIVSLAANTGAPILPLGAIADRYWSLTKSWDHFRIPKPFARVRVIYGPPVVVPKGAQDRDYEKAIVEVTNYLTQIETEAAKFRIS